MKQTIDSSSFILPPSSFAQRSLVLASLDIGRVLADRDGVTFRAQGTCMYPTVRPGDVLRIQSRRAAVVAVGDIAVCRTPDYLFSHRVIATGERDGRAYIVTRPDRSRAGSDAPTFDENLLGVVVAITRNGKPVPLQPTRYPWLIRRYYAARVALIEAKPRALFWLASALAHAQSHTLYRHIAHRLFMLTRPRISYSVRLPLNAKLGDAVYRQFAPAEFDAQAKWQGRAIDRWTLALLLNEARQSAAWMTFARNADATWRVVESYVRVRYRGVGLDDALMRQAEEILARSV
jgi:hypothetical protein